MKVPSSKYQSSQMSLSTCMITRAVFFTSVLLVKKIEGPVWHTIYHNIPVKRVTKPLYFHQPMRIWDTYPLVMTPVANWKITIYSGKIHYFYGVYWVNPLFLYISMAMASSSQTVSSPWPEEAQFCARSSRLKALGKILLLLSVPPNGTKRLLVNMGPPL